MKTLLELFCGSKSVGKVAEKLNYSVLSLDNNKSCKPDIYCDIMDFDYKKYDKFDVIWASPPCINYSLLQTSWLGREKIDNKTKKKYVYTKEVMENNMKESDKIVSKVLEIIEYFKSKNDKLIWFIENPASGRLKNRDIIKELIYYDICYCMYGYTYKKPTRIWTNKKNFDNKICNKRTKCKNKKHIKWYEVPRDKRYTIPKKLIKELLAPSGVFG